MSLQGQLIGTIVGLPLELLTRDERPNVADGHGEVPFCFYPQKPQASTLLQEDPRFGPAMHYEVPCVSMEEVFSENQLDYIDVLLLDCEGSEYGILQEIIEKGLPIEQIHVEVDLKGRVQEWEELQKELQQHYTLIQQLDLVEPDLSPLFLFRRRHE